MRRIRYYLVKCGPMFRIVATDETSRFHQEVDPLEALALMAGGKP